MFTWRKKSSSQHATKGASRVDQLIAATRGASHPEFPLLSACYSPASRVPCTDLIPHFTKWLQEGDVSSVKRVMRMVIAGNPGVGVGGNWTDQAVDDVLSIDTEKYLRFSASIGIHELNAFLIVASKAGGPRQAFLTENSMTPAARALLCRGAYARESAAVLATKANQWIDKKAKELPFWRQFPRFTLSSEQIEVNPVLAQGLAALSPASRMHFFRLAETNGGSLLAATNYPIRDLGIEVDKSAEELLASDAVRQARGSDALESSYSKADLLKHCEAGQIEYRKSWTKAKLAQAIFSQNESLGAKLCAEQRVVAINFSAFPEPHHAIQAAESLESVIRLVAAFG